MVGLPMVLFFFLCENGELLKEGNSRETRKRNQKEKNEPWNLEGYGGTWKPLNRNSLFLRIDIVLLFYHVS